MELRRNAFAWLPMPSGDQPEVTNGDPGFISNTPALIVSGSRKPLLHIGDGGLHRLTFGQINQIYLTDNFKASKVYRVDYLSGR